MPRFHHGCAFDSGDVPHESTAVITSSHSAAAAQPAKGETRFGFLFPDLQIEPTGALLEKTDETVDNLIALGVAMDDTAEENALDSTVPAIFTYFGQFITHDISWEKGTRHITSEASIRPWRRAKVEAIVNKRSSRLDLDCIYGDGAFDLPLEEDGRLKLGRVALSANRPANKDDFNDLFRKPHSTDPELDRTAIIGDPRNDENLIISQLHVAFMRAHNELMKTDSFDGARNQLVQLYQTIVVEDYLARIILPDVLKEYRAKPDLLQKGSFMPVEFSAAAFRFGHTMIRKKYDLNRNFKGPSRQKLTRLFGVPGQYHNVPESWIIQWQHFIAGGSNVARRVTTQLVEPLSLLIDTPANPFRKQPRLAVRDLLRGYIFRLPTGQSLADALQLSHEKLTAEELQRVVTPSQWEVLKKSNFVDNTPLWFYILAEAAREKLRKPDHDYLGPVGSHIVAGVLMGLILKSKNSIFEHGYSPLGTTLNDLLRLGGVLP